MKKYFLYKNLFHRSGKILKNFIGFIYLFIGFLFVSILGYYNPWDPSWNTVTSHQTSHPLGFLGSYCADFFYQWFGLASFLIPFFLFNEGLTLFFGFKKPSSRFFFLPIIFFSTCGTLSFFYPPIKGGILGLIFHSFIPFPWFYYVNFFILITSIIYLFGWWRFFYTFIKLSQKEATQKSFSNIKPISFYEKNKNLTAYPIKKDKVTKSELKDPLLKNHPSSKDSTKNKIFHKKESKLRPLPSFSSHLSIDLGPEMLPSSTFLEIPNKETITPSQEEMQERAHQLEQILNEFGIRGEITQIRPGPVVTLFELKPAPGIKTSRVIGLAEDIARSMSALSARIATVPGQNVIGIELPNVKRETVYLREVLEKPSFKKEDLKLPLILGKNIGGEEVIADLARMPHLLVAGTTGSGKSVSINVMILSLLYKLSSDQCKFIMIDPKMLELSIYDGIPHLLTPVVTDPKKAVIALKWAVKEMERRYRAMSQLNVRNIDGFNVRLQEVQKTGEILIRRIQTGFDVETGKPVFENQTLDFECLPYIVIVVDEMADLMLVAGKEIEAAVQRLAQMARAAGIHLIMATQRPSVDVITGTIKANFPTRISFQVTSKIDSRTILGEQGGEQLLGQGDMLYMSGAGRMMRVHGPFVRDEEVGRIVQFLKKQSTPSYIEGLTDDPQEDGGEGKDSENSDGDELYTKALELIRSEKKVSTSFIQRHLQIGYNRAARIVDQMEKNGVISPANHVGKREILE